MSAGRWRAAALGVIGARLARMSDDHLIEVAHMLGAAPGEIERAVREGAFAPGACGRLPAMPDTDFLEPPVPHKLSPDEERIVRWLRAVCSDEDRLASRICADLASRIERGEHLIDPPVPHKSEERPFLEPPVPHVK